MDHKVSKDMISSGMIPSGEKTQADLGRTQYGSAPSPSKLMDAYKSMYDKKGETLDEGLMDAVKNVASKVSNSNIGNPRKPHIDNIKRAREKGFFKGIKGGEAQATAELRKAGDSETLKSDRRERVTQIMNKNNQEKNRTGSRTTGESVDLLAAYRSVYEHHQKDKDGNTIPHEDEEINEGKIPAGLQAYLDKKKGKKEDKKDMKEDADLFDVVSGVFVAEGYEEKDAYKVMSQLTEEQLNEIAISGTLATLGLIGTKLLGGAKVAAAAGKGVLSAGKALAVKGMGATKTALSGAKNIAQTGMSKATKAFGKVTNIAKPQQGPKLPPTQGPRQANLGDKFKQNVGDKMSDLGKFVGDEVKGEIKRKIVQGDSGNKVTPIKTGTASAGSYQAASADLFDIVKGQLLDEGMSEEEIKDIMLTLTPDEILNEISVGKMANYISAADKDVQKTADSMRKDSSVMGDDPRVKKMTSRAKGMAMAGDKIAKKMNPSLPRTEEYKNFDPKNPDPKQVKKQAEQEKNRQKFNDPRGVKNTNIGGQGLDPMDK